MRLQEYKKLKGNLRKEIQSALDKMAEECPEIDDIVLERVALHVQRRSYFDIKRFTDAGVKLGIYLRGGSATTVELIIDKSKKFGYEVGKFLYRLRSRPEDYLPSAV